MNGSELKVLNVPECWSGYGFYRSMYFLNICHWVFKPREGMRQDFDV